MSRLDTTARDRPVLFMFRWSPLGGSFLFRSCVLLRLLEPYPEDGLQLRVKDAATDACVQQVVLPPQYGRPLPTAELWRAACIDIIGSWSSPLVV